jgi:hypothetical protein
MNEPKQPVTYITVAKLRETLANLPDGSEVCVDGQGPVVFVELVESVAGGPIVLLSTAT